LAAIQFISQTVPLRAATPPQEPEFAKKAIYHWEVFVNHVSYSESNFQDYRDEILEEINYVRSQKHIFPWFFEKLTDFVQRHKNF
jgi:hypothetical protein